MSDASAACVLTQPVPRPPAPAHAHARSRSDGQLGRLDLEVSGLSGLEMHELASALDDDELPSYDEVVRDRPPPMPPSAGQRHHRSQSLGAGAGPGWVRDPDGQWRQGRRRVPAPAPSAGELVFRPGAGERAARGRPVRVVPRARASDEPDGSGRVWRKRMGVWYATTPRERDAVEHAAPHGERWRRTRLGVWHVVREPYLVGS